MRSVLLLLPLLFSCVTIDPVTEAFAANDITLIGAACSKIPNGGADICRFKEGSKILQAWRLTLPKSKNVDAGELEVCFRDVCKTYPLSKDASQVVVPFTDLIKDSHWKLEHDGIVQALGSFQFKVDGVMQRVRLLGFAILVILQRGYNPVPIDSGYEAITITCKSTEIQYTTSGRSAIKCND